MNNVSETKKTGLKNLAVYTEPRVVAIFFLGFSAGLPYPLLFTTLTNWLSREGIEKSTIGFFAWAGITYSIKLFWSPIVDRAPLPLLTRLLGRRRSWILFAQIGVCCGLIGMSLTDPTENILLLAAFTVFVAIASATQDIGIDAYRIEAVEQTVQGAMAAAYQTGWRIGAALIGGAAALYIAEIVSWTVSYLVMTVCMSAGIITVLVMREPERPITQATIMNEAAVVRFLERAAHIPDWLRVPTAWFIGAVICPFTDFFQRNGYWALLLLFFIATYRAGDIVMANMAQPLYVELGFSNIEIANITKVYGLLMTIIGAAVGGVAVLRWGHMRCLLIGALLVAGTNLLYAKLAIAGNSLGWLTFVISADNFAVGFSSTAFLAFLASLTNTAYTATQYALFSSLMTLPAKILSGFSGVVVDSIGFPLFFVYAAALGVPSMLVVIYFLYAKPRGQAKQIS